MLGLRVSGGLEHSMDITSQKSKGSCWDEDCSQKVVLILQAGLLSSTSHVSVLFGVCRSEIFYDTQPQENGIDMKRAAQSHASIRIVACVTLAAVTSHTLEASPVTARPRQALEFWLVLTTHLAG